MEEGLFQALVYGMILSSDNTSYQFRKIAVFFNPFTFYSGHGKKNSEAFQFSFCKLFRTSTTMYGNTIGFHPQTQNLDLHAEQIVPCESTAEEV